LKSQDIVDVLSKPNTWFTALKHDQAAYKRKPDGSYEVILRFHHAVIFIH